MDEACSNFNQPVHLARFQMDGVAVKAAHPQKTVGFVGVEVVAGAGIQGFDPSDFVGLFRQMGLHQAGLIFCPERAEGCKLLGR